MEIKEKKKMCLDCGQDFIISKDERKSFRSHKQKLPNRCPFCRNIRWQEERTLKRQILKHSIKTN